MKARTNVLTIAFYVAFALWFTATRYGSPSFYDWVFTPVVGYILGVCTVVVFFMVVALAAWRAVEAASMPWLDVAVVGGVLVGSDLFWRYYLSAHTWDAFKLTSIVFDSATPLIAALGMAVLVSELKRRTRPVVSEPN